MSQGALGAQLDVGDTTIANWEAARGTPKNGLVWDRLAEALQISTIFLQYGKPSDQRDEEFLDSPIVIEAIPHLPEGVINDTRYFGGPLVLKETPRAYGTSHATRADCENLLKEYLDAAERDPNGIPHAYITMRQHLRPESFAQGLETDTAARGAEIRRRARVDYPARPEGGSSSKARAS